MNRHVPVAGVLACVSAILSSAAAAQGAPALQEITVTAERRETQLQDTPLSLVALTAETLGEKGIEDLGDLALFTPNLAINGSRGSGNNQPTFSIRGISGGGGPTSERGVALYIDGIFVPRTNGSVLRVFDLERVEVLRGPQGTLFGRNSTGGAIRLVTKQPGKELEGYVRATGGNFGRRDVSAVLNAPMSDTASMRVQIAHLQQDGYVRRGPQELGSSDDWVARVQTLWTPSENLEFTLGLLYSDSRSDGNPADFETWDMAPGIVQGNYADWVSDALGLVGQNRLSTTNDPRIIRDDYSMPDWCFLDDFDPDWDDACRQKNNNKYKQADLNVQWTLSDTMSLTSISGWAKLDHQGDMDWQLLGTENRPSDVRSRVLYQEFQLNAALWGGKVDLVTGLNYFQEISGQNGRVVTRRGSSTFSPAGGAANGDRDGGLFTNNWSDIEQKSDSYGWFNSATWHVTDKLNFTGGARLAYDKKDYSQRRYRASDFTPAAGTDSTFVTADDSWTEVDWRGTLDYHFSQDIMGYVTASKAYRAGQYSFNVLPNIAGPQQSGDFIKPIPPEEVVNYELGFRATLFDGRLRVNPTAFSMQWSNRQASRQVNCASEGAAACPIGFRILTVNSGDVDIYGVEFDTQFALTDNLTLDGALGITRYKLADPVANSGPNLFPSQASPTYNAGITYALPAGDRGRFAFNLNWAYVGEQETHPTAVSPTGDSGYRLPSYGLTNARVQWVSQDGRNTISLFANNLTDETYATYATRFGGGYWDSGSGAGVAAPPRSARNAVRGRPREIGITLQHNF